MRSLEVLQVGLVHLVRLLEEYPALVPTYIAVTADCWWAHVAHRSTLCACVGRGFGIVLMLQGR